MNGTVPGFPEKGLSRREILSAMQEARGQDYNWRAGRLFSSVYPVDQEIYELLKEAFNMFFTENGLNPTVFPSLRKFENEVIAMSASLLGGDHNVVGNMTLGGTESLLLAVKTARDWARVHMPTVKEPEILLPASAHPAFDKAAQYFGVRAVRVPVRPDLRADVDACRLAITPQTILLVGSAPAYPHGVVDPISELAGLAQERGLLFHTDACVGGFFLPFVRRLGYTVPDFDFSIPGVTSISADLHKYGYAAKPASVILYRDHALRRHQFFATVNWSGGIYASPTMAGTRPGGPIAAAWAVMHFLGEQGYLEITKTVMETVQHIRQGIDTIPGLRVLSNPEMSVMALAADKLNIYEIADEMSLRGWHLDRQQSPPSLHLTVNWSHTAVADEFLRDLAESARAARRPGLRKSRDAALLRLTRAAVRLLPEKMVSQILSGASSGVSEGGGKSRSAPIYGMVGSLPNRGDLHELVLDLLDGMTRVPVEKAIHRSKE